MNPTQALREAGPESLAGQHHPRELGEPAEPHERLPHTALTGDRQLFARQDSVEETWPIVQLLLDHPPLPARILGTR